MTWAPACDHFYTTLKKSRVRDFGPRLLTWQLTVGRNGQMYRK